MGHYPSGKHFSKTCATRKMMQNGIDEILWGRTFKNTSDFSLRFTTTFTTRFLDSRWLPEFTMGSWIHKGFLDSRWIPRLTKGSWIHDGILDPRWVPGFTRGSWVLVGFLVLCTARHGNTWHGTHHRGMARKYLARHGS